MQSKTKILFLCHGNINRSAAAEVISTIKYSDVIEARSAGLKANGGAIMARKMRDALKESGYEFRPTRAKAVTLELLQWADVVYYMDNSNRRRLAEFCPAAMQKSKCLGDLIGRASIPDPHYNGTQPVTVEQIERALEALTTGQTLTDIPIATKITSDAALVLSANVKSSHKSIQKPIAPKIVKTADDLDEFLIELEERMLRSETTLRIQQWAIRCGIGSAALSVHVAAIRAEWKNESSTDGRKMDLRKMYGRVYNESRALMEDPNFAAIALASVDSMTELDGIRSGKIKISNSSGDAPQSSVELTNQVRERTMKLITVMKERAGVVATTQDAGAV